MEWKLHMTEVYVTFTFRISPVPTNRIARLPPITKGKMAVETIAPAELTRAGTAGRGRAVGPGTRTPPTVPGLQPAPLNTSQRRLGPERRPVRMRPWPRASEFSILNGSVSRMRLDNTRCADCARAAPATQSKPEESRVDDCFWEELQELDPADVCRRSGAEQRSEGFLIRALGRDYLLLPGERRMRGAETDPAGDDEADASSLCFSVVHYLINARDIPRSGELVAASELKGGKMFFAAGAHSPDFAPLVDVFSTSQEAVERAAGALGGRRVSHGDIAVEVRALPRLPITFVYWQGDEEFPASISMLFDRTAEQQLPLDVVLAIGQETMRRLAQVARQEMDRGQTGLA